MFTIRNCSEEDAKRICSWKYEGEYSIYNFSPWETVCDNGWDLSDHQKRNDQYVSVLLDGELFGFYTIVNHDNNVKLGVGMRPDMCGRHYGVEFVKLAMKISDERYPEIPIVIRVRIFNKRAIKCYENCGFTITSKYYEDKSITPGEMYIMKLKEK